MSKATGLAAFTRKGKTAASEPEQPVSAEQQPRPTPQTNQRRRGKNPLVSLTVRLKRSDWERVHQLAVSDGFSIQKLAFDGLSNEFVKRGLPPLDDSMTS